MTVFGTDMHLATFIFVVCEVLFFLFLSWFYISKILLKRIDNTI